MKTIPKFSGCWLSEPIDILDNEQGMVQMRMVKPLTEAQQRATVSYLVAEGFLIPKDQPDSYSLPDDFSDIFRDYDPDKDDGSDGGLI